MITNEDNNVQFHKTNIERAMELAREEGRRKDELVAKARENSIISFSADDEVLDEAHLIMRSNGPVGMNDKGQPVYGETRVYIVNAQEKDMNQTNQTEVQAAAEAAESAFNEQLNTLIDEGMVAGQKMIDDLNVVDREKAAEASAQETSTASEPEANKFSFKALFKDVGDRASALKDKMFKAEAKPVLDQEFILEGVKLTLAVVIATIDYGMAQLPRGRFIPTTRIAA